MVRTFPQIFAMRFFTRVVAICNICFILAVILRAIELSKRAVGNTNGAIPFQPLESTIVILGYGAILVNFLYLPFVLLSWRKQRLNQLPRWIVLFNLLMLPVQIYFHFFYL